MRKKRKIVTLGRVTILKSRKGEKSVYDYTNKKVYVEQELIDRMGLFSRHHIANAMELLFEKYGKAAPRNVYFSLKKGRKIYTFNAVYCDGYVYFMIW